MGAEPVAEIVVDLPPGAEKLLKQAAGSFVDRLALGREAEHLVAPDAEPLEAAGVVAQEVGDEEVNAAPRAPLRANLLGRQRRLPQVGMPHVEEIGSRRLVEHVHRELLA